MNDSVHNFQEIVPGALAYKYDLEASFTRGTLEGLAAAVRDAVWQHFQLFENAAAVVVFVGGNRRNAMEPALEVSLLGGSRMDEPIISAKLMRALQQARSKNLGPQLTPRFNQSGLKLPRQFEQMPGIRRSCRPIDQ